MVRETIGAQGKILNTMQSIKKGEAEMATLQMKADTYKANATSNEAAKCAIELNVIYRWGWGRSGKDPTCAPLGTGSAGVTVERGLPAGKRAAGAQFQVLSGHRQDQGIEIWTPAEALEDVALSVLNAGAMLSSSKDSKWVTAAVKGDRKSVRAARWLAGKPSAQRKEMFRSWGLTGDGKALSDEAKTMLDGMKWSGPRYREKAAQTSGTAALMTFRHEDQSRGIQVSRDVISTLVLQARMQNMPKNKVLSAIQVQIVVGDKTLTYEPANPAAAQEVVDAMYAKEIAVQAASDTIQQSKDAEQQRAADTRHEEAKAAKQAETQA